MKSKRVMIVDDDKIFLNELKELLESSGYETIVISDSTQAFGMAQRKKPNVILLDMRMDGMNGYQVTMKLKQSPDTSHIPIIAMTGYSSEEDFGLKLM